MQNGEKRRPAMIFPEAYIILNKRLKYTENIFPQTQTIDCLSDESHCTESDI